MTAKPNSIFLLFPCSEAKSTSLLFLGTTNSWQPGSAVLLAEEKSRRKYQPFAVVVSEEGRK